MNRPWLRPLIAAVIVVAVTTAGVFVGLALSQPSAVVEAPLVRLPMEPAEVLAASAGEGDDGAPFSESTATIPVVSEPYEGLSPETIALLDAMTEASDPLDALATPAVESAGDYGVSLFSRGDDPCAEEGADDCPDGVRGTVLALYGSEPLEARALVNPPSYSDDPYSEVSCPTVAPEAGAITLGVATNKPTTLSIDYWPETSARGAADTVHLDVALDPVEEADWDAHSGDRNTLLQAYWVQHCVRIGGLEPGVGYVGTVTSIPRDELSGGRNTRISFSAAGNARPATEVLPSGNGMLYVTTYHELDVDATISARLLAVGEAATCDVDSPNELRSVYSEQVSGVSGEWLRDNGYGDEFLRRTSTAYYVPEGSYLVVCVSQAKQDAPSWLDENPLRAERFLVTSPDRTVAVVTVRAVVPAAGELPDSALVSASTVEGQLCGSVESADRGAGFDYGVFTNTTLCDATSTIGRALGSDGSLAIATRARHDGDSNYGLYLLDLAPLVCVGDCPDLPAPSSYSIPLGARESAEATVRLNVSWEQGNQNGASAWEVEQLSSWTLPDVVPDAPRMDTSRVLTAAPIVSGLPLDHMNVFFSLVPDRPVEYAATLHGDCEFSDDTALGTATTRQLTGNATGPVQLTFLNVCFGARYEVEVSLTDSNGVTTTYSPSFGYGERWLGGRITTPRLQTTVDYAVDLSTPATSSGVWLVDSVELWIDGRYVSDLADEGSCLGAATLTAVGNGVLASFATESRGQIRVSLYLADGRNRVNADGSVTTECSAALTGRASRQSFDFDINARSFHVDPYTTSHTTIESSRLELSVDITRVQS
jgi:hypothetical protein